MTDCILTTIYRGRISCLKENEEPRDVLIGIDLEHAFRGEISPGAAYTMMRGREAVMGMWIEWKEPGFGISVRTATGDIKRVSSSTTQERP